MSLLYGLECYTSTGQKIVSPEQVGAVFVGKVVCSITSGTQVIDYPSVPFGGLFALQFGEGVHTWVITDNTGTCRLTFTWAKEVYQVQRSTTLYLFANNTVEPNYGVNVLNELGQRVVSTIFPATKFLGKKTLNTTPSTIDSQAYQYSTTGFTYAPAAGNSPLVFWSLPNSSDTSLWWQGNPGVFGTGASTTCRMYCKTPNTPPSSSLPEAFLFETGPVQANSDYGIRVYDASGNIMFDGATDSLVVLTMIVGAEFATTPMSYTLPSGYTPAMFMPQWAKEGRRGACSDGLASRGEYKGMYRRSGTTLYTSVELFEVIPEDWTCSQPDIDLVYGMKTGLAIPIISAERFGGTTI